MQTIILGLGAGQCGLKLLADILNRQPGVRVTHEEKPLLPWEQQTPRLVGVENEPVTLIDRINRWKAKHHERFIGDVASFYLPYVEEAIQNIPDVKIICLKRSRDEIVSSFILAQNKSSPRPTDNWSKTLSDGWYRDPLTSHIYPKYEAATRKAALEMYWDEYYDKANDLAHRFPEHFQMLDTDELTDKESVRKLLTFVGIPASDQIILTGNRPDSLPDTPPDDEIVSRWKVEREKRPNSDCVVLVPFLGYIHQECDSALKELERRGYQVRRVGGYSAIDQGRNQMATDALVDGFEETLWIDSDVAFHPDDIDKLRAHPYPIVAGLYPQKGRRALASHIVPGEPNMTFGKKGGLVNLLYAGTGFLLVRREVYLTMQEQLKLPICNDRFGHPMIPFFQPLIRRIEDGTWYLAEDYAFCHRAQTCGYEIFADTTIRLWHIGHYKYSWEDAGMERPRFETFTLNFGMENQHGRETSLNPSLQNLIQENPWPDQKPDVQEPPSSETMFSEELHDLLVTTISKDSRFILVLGDPWGKVSRRISGIAHHAIMTIKKQVKSFPKYQIHKASKRAFVWWNGKRHYLGIANSGTSIELYNRFIAEIAQAGILFQPVTSVTDSQKSQEVTVGYLMARYLTKIQNEISEKEVLNTKYSLRPLRKLFAQHTRRCGVAK